MGLRLKNQGLVTIQNAPQITENYGVTVEDPRSLLYFSHDIPLPDYIHVRLPCPKYPSRDSLWPLSVISRTCGFHRKFI
jgi:hypothetical protein